MNLNKNDIDDLRLVADKLAMRGEFQAGRVLNELLDAFEVHEEAAEKTEDLEAERDELKDWQRRATNVLREVRAEARRQEQPENFEVRSLLVEVFQ